MRQRRAQHVQRYSENRCSMRIMSMVTPNSSHAQRAAWAVVGRSRGGPRVLPHMVQRPFSRRRRRDARADSVTQEMLEQRDTHLSRLESYVFPTARRADLAAQRAVRLSKMGLGKKKHAQDMRYLQRRAVGALGHGAFMSKASKPPWPTFRHMLPEIAVAGHSNVGKSSLVNALTGLDAGVGPAHISNRAGWTSTIHFYKLGRKPPVVTLVDLPGYGHAVASEREKAAWLLSMRRYLTERTILARCCVLVDSTRGLCDEDIDFMQFLSAEALPYQVVLTKGDLLTTEHLATCVDAVQSDLHTLDLEGGGRGRAAHVPIVSGHTKAGINEFWMELLKVCKECTVPHQGVLVHKNALLQG